MKTNIHPFMYKDVTTKPVLEPSGGKMECESQPRVQVPGQGQFCGMCQICGQLTGRGLRHPCSIKNIQLARRSGRARSIMRNQDVRNRRKRNLSMLVGKESEEAQEQIVSSALTRIIVRKGDRLRMKQMDGGGVGGMGKEITVGAKNHETTVLPIELFQEIKKCLNQSKAKMEEMCRIMRKHKVKMEPNVRAKLHDIDHLLDDEYVSLRVMVTKTETVEVEDDPAKKRRGPRRTNPGKRTERKEVKVERDLTILKNPRCFISRLIQERGQYEPDIMHRVSADGGDKSVKVIMNSFDKHQDLEVTFPRVEKKGNLCSGVNRSIVLAYCEDLEENYTNMRMIMELLQIDELDFVVATDLKLLNILLGLSGHGGKYACVYCEGEKVIEAGKARTFSSIIQCYENYQSAGANPKKMMDNANVINMPLIKPKEDQLIEESVPPPELHLVMGATNHLLELIRRLMVKIGVDEEELWSWCNSHGITRRGYNGKNKLDGNNASRFLTKMMEMEDCDWFPQEARPIIGCLQAFRDLKDKCFSWELDDGWEVAINLYIRKFTELQEYSMTVLGLELSCTWKIHVLACHLKPFLSKHQCGMARFAEQTGESIHAKMKPVLGRHKRKPGHKEHAIRQKNAVVEFSSNNV